MEVVAEGILNRAEPSGHRATATFPSVTVLHDGTLLASYRVGTSKECDDETVELRQSADGGCTWSEPTTPFSPVVQGIRGSLKHCYIVELAPGHLLASPLWVDRQAHPGKPLFNPDTEGCLPMSILFGESTDAGKTWTPWRVISTPEEIGPPSLTNPVLMFPDGTLALSIESNKIYDDRSPWKQRVVHLHSHDRGKTWDEPTTVAYDPSHRIFYWDQRAGISADGILVTFSWTYDRQTNAYRNVHRRISRDKGSTWSAFDDLGFADQPSHPAMLPDGRVVVAWVDRFGTSSIRARMARAAEAAFEPESEVVIYDHKKRATTGRGTSDLLAEMGRWSYGLPYAEALPDGQVLVLYYAGTDTCMDIRFAKLRL